MADRFHFGCRVFFLGVAGMWLMACGTRRKAMQQDVQAQWRQQELRADSSVFSSSRIVDALGHRVVQVQWSQTVFDTQSPPDPHTGLPPVKSRSEAVVSIEQTDSVRHTHRTDSCAVSRQERESGGQAAGSTSRVSGRRQSTLFRQLAGMLLAAAVLVISISYYKFRRRKE